MSIYNFYHHINPDYKKILLEISVYGKSLPRFEGEESLNLIHITRIRDVFYKDGMVHLLTRMGGKNRKTYQNEIDKLRSIDGFIEDFDCDFCNSYAVFIYKKSIDTKDYYRQGYSNEVELIKQKSELTNKVNVAVAKVINEEDLTLEDKFIQPHNLISYETEHGIVLDFEDREDIINVIKWQTDPDYIWKRYKEGKMDVK